MTGHQEGLSVTSMRNLKEPDISVILPVYNGALYLKESVDSILNQTFQNFEVIILNDGSTDSSEDIIKSYADSRIIYIKQENCGLALTLNRGIEKARGKYIARQDQDDISLPDRFDHQIAFLEKNPDVAVVGCWAKILSDNDKGEFYDRHPDDYSSILIDLLFDNPIVHSSAMIRKSVLYDVGLYTTDKNRQPPEDYELWSRIARKYQLNNIPEVLHLYRQVPSGMSNDSLNPFFEKVFRISQENIAYYAGRDVDDPVVWSITELTHGCKHEKRRLAPYRKIKKAMKNIWSSISMQSITSKQNKDKWLKLNNQMHLNYFKYRLGKGIGYLITESVFFFRKIGGHIKK